MDEVEVQKMLDQKFKDVQTTLSTLQTEGASKEELQKAITAVEKQGQALEDFIDNQAKQQVKTFTAKFGEFLKENKDEIQKIYKGGSGEIEFNPFVGKVVGDIDTTSGVDSDTVPTVIGAQLGSFNLRNDNDLLSLCSVSSTRSAVASYTDMLPKDGDYTFVLEGASKPQIDFNWETRYLTPKKIAAHEILTEEAVTDYTRLQSVAKEYLSKRHDLFKVNSVFFAAGTGSLPTGATVYGRTFVAGGMSGILVNGTAKFMDVVNAAITDVYVTQNFADEAHYQPNVVMISPIDFFIQFQAAKDGNGLPLYPQASLFNTVTIGGVTIKPWIKIPAGKIFVADMSKYHIINYVPFSIRIGWINDQFITNKFTMVGESRFYQYVKNLDQAAFIYDDIATIITAIEAV